MSIPPLFITVPYSLIKNETTIFNEKEIGINVLIDSTEIEMTVIMNFIASFHFHYLFSISGSILNASNKNKILLQLYTLFTLSGSFPRNKNCIPVFSDDQQLPDLSIVKKYFQLHGEQNIEFPVFKSTDEYNIESSILFFTTEAFQKLNESLFEKYRVLATQQIILSTANTENLEDEIVSIKSALKDNKYAELFLELTGLKADATWLTHKSNLWEKRAVLYHSFISISKEVGETQYYNIVDWYKKEYEVLPLWYKRFGHIIKVVIGKKSLKSLVDKNKK